ncbi:hypothetical protein HMPREF0581_1246 [Mogibacterium timidum ATCC 33093]|uniref:Uncharacterized protein n=1 Tax=Mogibacterium timidum ATCC 33093 TaxID=1401079 RepID=X8J6Y0_9FIRM|nr:hypothetical protein HMPREF0581_1246 [Mogibacterium timidum ATCC 33093]
MRRENAGFSVFTSAFREINRSRRSFIVSRSVVYLFWNPQ